MKRLPLLLFCLALALPAAPGHAEIALGGEAAMGLNLDGAGKLRAGQRTRLDITGSSVTDGGVEFGAEIRIHDQSGGAGCGNGSAMSGGGAATGQARGRCRGVGAMLFLKFGEN